MAWHSELATYVDVAAIAANAVILLSTTLAIFLALTAGRFSWVQSFFVLSPLRRASTYVAERDDYHWTKVKRRQTSRELARFTSKFIKDQLHGDNRTVAGLVSTICLTKNIDRGSTELKMLFDIAANAATPSRRNAIAEHLWEEQSGLARKTFEDLRDYLASVGTPESTANSDGNREFADIVSAFTGCLVLADGTRFRSNVVDKVRVWHRLERTGPARPHPKLLPPGQRPVTHYGTETPFAAAHAGFNERSLTTDSGLDERHKKWSPRPGDYDGRIFDLQSVSIESDPMTGVGSVVLGTKESCYAVSEADALYACKGLEPDHRLVADLRTPSFRRERGRIVRGTRAANVDSRVVLLNTCVTILANGPDGLPVALLARRTNKTRNAQNVLSATAGGVFEHRRGNIPGDQDEWGCPDPQVGMLRELKEELGLDLDAQKLPPVAVYLANTHGRATPKSPTANGQLVATVCFIARVGMTVEEIKATWSTNSDWRTGRFELDDLSSIPLPPAESRDPDDLLLAAEAFLTNVDEHLDELDHPAIIGLLYSAAYQYEPGPLSRALASRSKPWWAYRWRGESHGTWRVTRRPSFLFGEFADDIARAQPDWHALEARLFDTAPADSDSQVGPIVE